MSAYVVDENVPRVANELSRINTHQQRQTPQADLACIASCVRKLRELQSAEIVVLDDGGNVLRAYRRNLSGKGQPGSGDAFFRYISERQYDPKRVRRVPLDQNDEGKYEVIPQDSSLNAFDEDDLIYVALVLTDQCRSNILNAVDSDYLEFENELLEYGIYVEELCPHSLRRIGR